MRKSKKEQFGHKFFNCKDDNCKMFHQDVCSDSDIEAGNCSAANLAKHEEYKKNKPNPNLQFTKKNIGTAIMFKDQQTANQQTDNTVSQNAQVNNCPEGREGSICRHKIECKKWGRIHDGKSTCTKECINGPEGDNCRMLNCLTKGAKDIFKQKCDQSNYKDFFRGKLKGNLDVDNLTKEQCNEFLYTLFELYGGKPRDSSRPKEVITLENNMCKDLNTVPGKNNCYNDIIKQISKQVLKMNDSDIKKKLNCTNKNAEHINLKQHENISLPELCSKLGM